MGLDIALGILILLWAIRGWFKGFARQLIGLVALVSGVYLASPLRDLARPHVTEYLPSLRADVLDRLIWWTCAVVCAVVVAGIGSWMLRWKKPKNPYAPSEPNRADQGAGFVLGAAKGSIAVSFLVAAFQHYVPEDTKAGHLVDEQRKSSRALALSKQYRPADRLWHSQPVQAFVSHIRRNGFWEDPVDAVAPGAVPHTDGAGSTVEAIPSPTERPETPLRDRDESVRTARRTPALVVPRERRLDPRSPTFLHDVDDELRHLGLEPTKSR